MMSEPAQKCENQAIFMQNYTLELFLLLKWSIIAILAQDETYMSSIESFITSSRMRDDVI